MPEYLWTAFPNSLDAHIQSAVLWSLGIPNEVVDEAIVDMDWRYSLAVGGVKIRIPLPYAEDYLDYQEERRRGALDLDDQEFRCPHCGHGTLKHKTYPGPWMLALFFVTAMPIPELVSRERCSRCGRLSRTLYELQKIGNLAAVLVWLTIAVGTLVAVHTSRQNPPSYKVHSVLIPQS